jgi:hypothetical protein
MGSIFATSAGIAVVMLNDALALGPTLAFQVRASA